MSKGKDAEQRREEKATQNLDGKTRGEESQEREQRFFDEHQVNIQ